VYSHNYILTCMYLRMYPSCQSGKNMKHFPNSPNAQETHDHLSNVRNRSPISIRSLIRLSYLRRIYRLSDHHSHPRLCQHESANQTLRHPSSNTQFTRVLCLIATFQKHLLHQAQQVAKRSIVAREDFLKNQFSHAPTMTGGDIM